MHIKETQYMHDIIIYLLWPTQETIHVIKYKHSALSLSYGTQCQRCNKNPLRVLLMHMQNPFML